MCAFLLCLVSHLWNIKLLALVSEKFLNIFSVVHLIRGKKGSHFFNNNNNLCCLKLFSHASHTISPRSESHVVCDWVKSQAMFAMWKAALMGFTAAYARGATRKAKKLGYGSRSIEEGKSLLLHELNSVLGGGVGRAALLESCWVWRLSLWQTSFLVH